MWTIGMNTYGFTSDQVVFLIGLYFALRFIEWIANTVLYSFREIDRDEDTLSARAERLSKRIDKLPKADQAEIDRMIDDLENKESTRKPWGIVLIDTLKRKGWLK